MAHVFISYSSNHRDATEKLAAFLEGCGPDVWWDRELVARGPFDGQIMEQLRTAGCVVVLWTKGALKSEWVKTEADYALAQDKLINVRDDNIKPRQIPRPFDKIDAHQLSERDLILRDVLAVREGRLLLEHKREPIPEAGARTPTMLLQAKFGLVPFTGGEDIKTDFLDWALARGAYAERVRRAAGRLMHGSGGVGKTRLLIEGAEALRAEGWSAGFLSRPDAADDGGKRERRAKALSHLIRGATDKGLLLVMDYAEGRNEEIARLAQQIQARPRDDTRAIRLVLLVRGAGDWWTRLVEDHPEVQALFSGDPVKLDVHALAGIATNQDRLSLFDAAVKAFAPLLTADGYATPTAKPDTSRISRIETGDGYDRPLAIIMEALLYLTAMSPGSNEPGVHSLLANILGLERDHWRKVLGPLVPDSRRDPDLDMRRAVAQVTSLQGIESLRLAEDLFMADRYYAGQRLSRSAVREVTDNIAKVYGIGDRLTHLEPDLIGEHHVGHVADPELLDGCLSWIDTEPDPKKRAARQRDFITVLQRASRPEHGAAGVGRAYKLLDHLILNHLANLSGPLVQVILDTPGAILDRLTGAISILDENSLAALDGALPSQTLKLRELSLGVAKRRVEHARVLQSTLNAADVHDRRVARAHTATRIAALGERLISFANYSEALPVLREAVDSFRQLHDEEPEAFVVSFALALSRLSISLSELGHHQEARLESNQAYLSLQHRDHKKGVAFSSELAECLFNHAKILIKTGEHGFSTMAMHAAVRQFKMLAIFQPDQFAVKLAKGLLTLEELYANQFRGAAGLSGASEAVDIIRPLAKTNPDAYLPVFLECLAGLAKRWRKVGQYQEALASSKEIVEISRALVKERPDTFLPDLASGLHDLGTELSQLGRPADAFVALREAVEIRRSLTKERANSFLPDLATSLHYLGIELSNLSRHEEALAAFLEAVKIKGSLLKDRGDTFLPDVATSLHCVGTELVKLKRSEDALVAFQEAVEIRRNLAKKSPETFSTDLFMSLLQTGVLLGNLGQGEKALTMAREMVDGHRALIQSGAPNLKGFAGSHHLVSLVLAALNRNTEALKSAQMAQRAISAVANSGEGNSFGELEQAIRETVAQLERKVRGWPLKTGVIRLVRFMWRPLLSRSTSGHKRSSADYDAASTVSQLLPLFDQRNGSGQYNHTGAINTLVMLPDGRLATGGDDKTIRVWSARNGSGLGVLEGHVHSITALAMLPRGGLISASRDKVIRLWRLNGKNERTLYADDDTILTLAVLPCGRLASAGDDTAIKLWSTDNSEVSYLRGHAGSVTALAAIPNEYLLSGSHDRTIRLWDIPLGLEVRRFEGHSDSVWALSVLTDQRLISGSRDKTIRIWDMKTAKEMSRLEGHTGAVWALAVIAGNILASGSYDGTVRLWDLTQEKEIARHNVKVPVLCLAALPNRKCMVAADARGSLHWLSAS